MTRLGILRELREAATMPPNWVRKAAKRENFVGPNGNTVVAYEWRWTYGEEYSEHEGGLTSRKMSDWDNAARCTSCNRQIVHIYWVQDSDTKQVKPYGGDHLHVALGYPRELKKRERQNIQRKVTADQSRETSVQDKYRARLSAVEAQTVRDANNEHRQKGWQPIKPDDIAWLYNRKTNQVAKVDKALVKEYLDAGGRGWQHLTTQEIREIQRG